MMRIQLGDLDQLLALESQASIYGEYQRYYICLNPLGYYIVAPNRDILTFSGLAVYTENPQDAGRLIEWQRGEQSPLSPSAAEPRSSHEHTRAQAIRRAKQIAAKEIQERFAGRVLSRHDVILSLESTIQTQLFEENFPHNILSVEERVTLIEEMLN